MRDKKLDTKDKSIVLLEKMLVFQLYALKIPQVRIAKIVGKKNDWVNDLLKGIPRGAKING